MCASLCGVTVPDVLTTSYSDITKFSQCKRAWYLGSFLGLRKIKQTRYGPLSFGSRVHLALEIAQKEQRWADITDIWNALMQNEFDHWRTLKLPAPPELVKESKLGYVMLEGYVRWRAQERHDENWEIIGVETQFGEYVDIALPDGRTALVLFRGKADIIMRRRTDGAIYILDYKTAQNFGEDTIVRQENSPQGPMYIYLQGKTAEGGNPLLKAEGVIYDLLRKVQQTATATPPFYKRMVIPITKDRLSAAMDNLGATAEEIVRVSEALLDGRDHTQVAPYFREWWCHGCEFRNPCLLMTRGNFAGAQDMLRDQYEAGDPFERYDKEAEVAATLSY